MSLGHTVPILHLSSRYIQNSKRILFKRFPPTLTLTLIPSNPQPRSPTTVLPEMIVSRHQIPLGKSEEPERRRSIVEPSTTRSPTSSPSSTLLPRRPVLLPQPPTTYLLPTINRTLLSSKTRHQTPYPPNKTIFWRQTQKLPTYQVVLTPDPDAYTYYRTL